MNAHTLLSQIIADHWAAAKPDCVDEALADAILADKRLDFRPRGTLADRMRWAAAVLIEADKRVTDEPPGGWDAQGLQDFAARFEREDADRAIEATDA